MRKLIVLLLFAVLGLTACKSSKYPDLKPGLYAELQTVKGDILLELRPDKAPVTVANFVSLAEGNNPYVKDEYKGKPFYDGLTFHRVVSKATGAKNDFVIQGGDPLGNGQGGPGYQFKNEISDLKHTKGALSMARESRPGTNGSQFFITLDATPFLDGKYSVFGYTVKGMDVVNKIRKGDTIKKVIIIRKGKEAKKFDAVKVFNDYMKEKEEDEKKEAAAKKKLADDLAAKKEKAVADESGLKIYIEKEGTGRKPKAGEYVSVHYTGYLTDGTKFDSSLDRGKPIEFQVGKGRVIAGWDKGIMQLKEGTKAILFIPSYMGYGERGAGGVIPPNADLIFEVELVKIGK
jgi:FKBP-type peptidyl-prolyl cis-trans isomerase